jgi:leucyl/phenylalanyl-tRNA--protein transferase
MFHTERDASKVALVHLVARLRRGGFSLLDTQFVTSHLAQFGAIEVPRLRYKQMLRAAMDHDAEWHVWPRGAVLSGEEVLAALSSPDGF